MRYKTCFNLLESDLQCIMMRIDSIKNSRFLKFDFKNVDANINDGKCMERESEEITIEFWNSILLEFGLNDVCTGGVCVG